MKKILFLLAFSSLAAQHEVVSGSVDVQFEGQRWDIIAETDRSVLHWDEFSIPADHAMHFHLPNETSALLNRVYGNLPSNIQGALHSNGSVFLVNPNGIIIGQDAFINVASLVATTLDFSNEEFLGGNEHLFQGNSLAPIENSGKLVAKNGDVILFAHRIVNKGTIEAENALLGTGHEILLCLEGTKHFYIKPSSEVADLLLNEGTISASNIALQATARPSTFAIQNKGHIDATAVVQENGKVYLRAKGGFLENRGTISASEIVVEANELAPDTSSLPVVYNHGTFASDGGTIDVTASEAYNFGTISAEGRRGGQIALAIDHSFIETESGRLSADGIVEGGSIAIRAHNYYSSGKTSVNGSTAGTLSIEADRLTLAAGQLHAAGRRQGGKIVLTSHSEEHPITLTAHACVHADCGRNPGTVELHTRKMPQACKGNFPLKHNVSLMTYSEEGIAVHDLEALGACIGDELEFVDPNLSGTSSSFGDVRVALSTGNIVITKLNDSGGGHTNRGAVYLYNGSNAALISTITGSSDSDFVGIDGVAALTGNGNYVISSSLWNDPSGPTTDVGAATWGSGTAGVSGVVSANNSLIGTTMDDEISSSEIFILTNGNYVVLSIAWDDPSGPTTNVGAATWGNGLTGITGTVSIANSLIGSLSGDFVSSNGLAALTNGNYVISSPFWNSSRGAATWGNGSTGVTGTVSAANSLIGSTADDGLSSGGITALTNGNYVVISEGWDNPGTGDMGVGAATWGNGTTGITGTVSAINSLIGSTATDRVGRQSTALTNGNYVVLSNLWNDPGGSMNVGAATWGNGTTGITGTVSISNSLIGLNGSDFVGNNGAIALTNGNYVVGSGSWDNGGVNAAGAATWGNGTTGITGTVSISNSLVGSTAIDSISSAGIVALTNGNYVVASSGWNVPSGPADVGAVTWGNGSTGITGTVSVANSLVGSSDSDFVASEGVAALTNGNYIVLSDLWDAGGTNSIGAVTWGSGSTGVTGTVSVANSLTGFFVGDGVGSGSNVTLTNGNYAIGTPTWNSSIGAATWGDGATGITGTVSIANSLVGSTGGDRVGESITTLSNGNYVVISNDWDSSTGSVTLGDGAAGTYCDAYGTVSTVNSFLGANTSAGLSTTVTSDTVNDNFLVQFTSYNSQTRVFAFDDGTIPSPAAAGPEIPPAKGRVAYNIAISETSQQWTATFLRNLLENNNAPPMDVHKRFSIPPLRSLLQKPSFSPKERKTFWDRIRPKRPSQTTPPLRLNS